jgi:GAF domain-containing protein/HAMP domain-containing protein
VLVFGLILYLLTRSITQPLRRLTQHANQLSAEKLHLVGGKLAESIQIHTGDELEDLAEAFNQTSNDLAQAFENLEEKVADRARNLERRSLELETIAEVAREITIIHDLDTLLNASANLIRERFKYYHVGIFLVDERREFAILRAASSIAAHQMLEQNYKLKVGQEGLVGNVTRTGQAHIALDVGTDAIHFQNPFLPETHSEIVLPLRSRSVTIGALDIQTNIQSAFTEQDVKVLQLLADQLAAAIENAQLVQQVEGTFTELNNSYRLQTQSVWQSTINLYERPSYEYDGIQVRAVPQHLPNDLLKRLENGEPIIVKENDESKNSESKTTLMVPLMVLNQVIGVIGLEQENPDHVWTNQEISIAQAAANRAGISLENARLLKESQRRAVKERTIFEATARIGSSLSIENILQATAEELEKVLSGAEVILQFQSEQDQKPEE